MAAITERFGADVIAADGTLNREALGAVVFGDDAARADLEAITHPAIIELAVALIMALAFAAVVTTFTEWLTGLLPNTEDFFSGEAGSFGADLLLPLHERFAAGHEVPLAVHRTLGKARGARGIEEPGKIVGSARTGDVMALSRRCQAAKRALFQTIKTFKSSTIAKVKKKSCFCLIA